MSIDIERILLELEQLPEFNEQISLQGVKDNTDYINGTGKLDELNHDESVFNVPLFPKMTYTYSIINNLNLFRTRVMKMAPRSCYSYHKDPTKRIHIPLITNDKCFMVIEDKCYWYPADGNYYLADTTKNHTFVNGSWEERIHIVGCIKE